jgi:ABC-type multidrug transport system ATPase subunit
MTPRNHWNLGHARLVEYEAGFALEDLGTPQGTHVNGIRLTPGKPIWVKPTDAFQPPFPWPAPHSATVPQPVAWSRQITIGSAPDNEHQLVFPLVAPHHALLLEDHAGALYLVDLGAAQPVAINAIGALIPPQQPIPVRPTDDVYFGSLKVPITRLRANTARQLSFRGTRMIIGRDPACDYPLPYPTLSWRHAEITRENGQFHVTDLGSRNGTFVNGIRCTAKTLLAPGAELSLGAFRFTLQDTGTFARREDTANVSIEAVSLTVDVGTHRLLNPVSLTLFPGEMTAVMGPAGAGKTTFLKALNGYAAPSHGHVLFNGDDLYQCYDRFRLQLGYVPQDDIMHALLTVEEALTYTARLRTDLGESEIKTRVKTVLTDLGIEDIANRQIGSPEMKVISGGQRKRVNIAMELLSGPNVLFLDEPTSGLSSYDALQVIRLLRRLANEGKTIVLTIHQPSTEIYKEFDNLVMISRDRGAATSGSLVYFGPAYPDSIKFFNPTADPATLSPEHLLDGLAQQPTAAWVTTYDRSPYRGKFIDDRTGHRPPQPDAKPASPIRKIGLAQWATLVRRNVALRLRDKGQSIFMALQSTLFPLLMAIVFGNLAPLETDVAQDWTRYAAKVTTVHFLMVVAAIWFGCNNAARDIVGEWSIFQRERMVSLKLPSYLFAKVAVLAAISLLQCFVLLGIVNAACHLSAPFTAIYLTLFLASQVGSAIGLLISAVSKTTESAIAFLPIPLLFMILLGGGIKPLHEMTPAADRLAMVFPSRWAFEANVLTEAAERPRFIDQRRGPDIAENVFPAANDARDSSATCRAVLIAMWCAFLALVLNVLRRRDTH